MGKIVDRIQHLKALENLLKVNRLPPVVNNMPNEEDMFCEMCTRVIETYEEVYCLVLYELVTTFVDGRVTNTLPATTTFAHTLPATVAYTVPVASEASSVAPFDFDAFLNLFHQKEYPKEFFKLESLNYLLIHF